MINIHDKVVCKNPKTGQVLTVGVKLFHSLYLDKGFELVNRDNTEPDDRADGRKPSPPPREPRSSSIGSAASVAAALGVANEGNQSPDPATSKSAIGSQSQNELETDIDQSGTISDERSPNKRDRGRSS